MEFIKVAANYVSESANYVSVNLWNRFQETWNVRSQPGESCPRVTRVTDEVKIGFLPSAGYKGLSLQK